MKFSDIPQFPQAHYSVDVSWAYLERHLAKWGETAGGMGGLDLDPDFQRAHVWSTARQSAFVEYRLRGGEAGGSLWFNSPDWGRSYQRPTVLVDGKQRLCAVRAFLRNELEVFGCRFADFEGSMRSFGGTAFRFHVASLETRADVLKFYLGINAGGTPHSPAELARVRAMLAEEEKG